MKVKSAEKVIKGSSVLTMDLIELAVGKPMGEGISRKVYEWLPDPTLVAKVECRRQSFANIEEYHVWQAVEETKAAEWFAPVVQLAGHGSILLQRRTKPVTMDQLPARIPSFFTDLKVGNFGMLDGRIVCHDYGVNLLREKSMTIRLVKADWWE